MPIIKTIKVRGEDVKKEPSRQYKVIGGLRWEMTDHYGYPIELSQIRNDRIDGLLSGSNDDVLESVRYSISLKKRDEGGWGHYNIDFYKGKLNLYSTVDDESTSHLRIKLNCKDFETAQKLIELICQSNDMEVMPLHRSEFKSR
jgi:hypothetical protein